VHDVEQVAAGRTDDQVKRFLTDRYGEFVLLKPSFSWGNAALWIAPFLVVAFGLGLLLMRLRERPAEQDLSADEARRLKDLT
jgi:cytochrome c-type biogenesis protein CcmH